MEGIGIYMRRLDKRVHGTPEQAAKKAKDHNVSFVAILACWQEFDKNRKFRTVRHNSTEQIVRYAEAFKKQCIDVWIWGYPWADAEDEYMDTMHLVAEACEPVGWIADPELGYKWPARRNPNAVQGEALRTVSIMGNEEDRRAAARRLCRHLDEAHPYAHAISSYGMCQYHNNFPWEEFGELSEFIGSPQFYTVSKRSYNRGMLQWRDKGWVESICPSVPAFGPKSRTNIPNYLQGFIDGPVQVQGFIFWSWLQLDRSEWRHLSRVAGWFDIRGCLGKE